MWQEGYILKLIALALLLAWQPEPFCTIEDYDGGPSKVSCQREAVPPGFICA
jgi:hypothetical protein